MKWGMWWVIGVVVLVACGGEAAATVVPVSPTAVAGLLMTPTVPAPTPPAGMVLIPAGAFTMGSEQAVALAECEKYFSGCDHEAWYLNESPVHEVWLDAFYMDLHEVTNGAYAGCVAEGVCTPPARNGSLTRAAYYDDLAFADFPVIWVSWEQAQAFCGWRGGRLPTEAEWEKAARGADGRLYPWGDVFEAGEGNFCDVNCTLRWANGDFDDGFADTAPVGSFAGGVNAFGLFDMGGNVNEWVGDWYDAAYYASSPLENPTGPESGSARVIRGGSYHTPGQGLRTTARPLSEPAADHIGFRCVVPVGPSP